MTMSTLLQAWIPGGQPSRGSLFRKNGMPRLRHSGLVQSLLVIVLGVFALAIASDAEDKLQLL